MILSELIEQLKYTFPIHIPNEVSEALEFQSPMRFTDYKEYIELYKGHDSYVEDTGEVLPTTRLPKKIVKTITTWLIGNGVRFKFPEENQTLLEVLVDEILENSKREIFWDIRDIMGIYGDVYVMPTFSKEFNYGKGGVGLVVYNPEMVLPVYKRILNIPVLEKVALLKVVNKQFIVEVWTKESIKIFSQTKGYSISVSVELISKGKWTELDGTKILEIENPYGFIPLVHFTNSNVGYELFGESDLEGLKGLCRSREKVLEDFEGNVAENNQPLKIFKGVTLDQIERLENKNILAGLPIDAKVETLEVTQTFEMLSKLLEHLNLETGFTAFPIQLMNLSNEFKETSNASLRLFFLPLISVIDRLTPVFCRNVELLMGNALQILNFHHKLGLENLTTLPDVEKINKDKRLSKELKEKLLKLRERPFYYLECKLDSYLPKNRTLELADVITELQYGLESWTGALTRLGIDNIEKKKNEILSDKDEYLKALPVDKANLLAKEVSNPGEGVKNGESPVQVEQRTGQSAERTQQQRALKGIPGAV